MPAQDRKKSLLGTKSPAAKRSVKAPPAGRKASAGKTAAKQPAVKKAAGKRAAAKQPAAKKAAGKQAAGKQAAARKAAVKKAPPPRAAARKPAAPRPSTRRTKVIPSLAGAGRREGPDPEGFFVARVRGEDAARDAPHQLLEPGGWEEEPPPQPLDDEGLGELPWTYGADLLVALPRDPRTLFVYWDQARSTVDASFAGVPDAKVQLWVFARGNGWERVRVIDVALEARGWYVHDLEPGRPYRAELHVIGSDGQDRVLPGPSIATALPPQGPSPIIDDRFATLPWDVPLPKLMGPGVPGGPFSEEARALLARLSGWEGFGHSHAGGGPTSPAGGPSSPSGPFGGEGR